MGGSYDYDLLDALNRIAKSAERAAAALEKLSPPGGQYRGAGNLISVCTSRPSSAEDRKALADIIENVLKEQLQEHNSQQQPCPTERTPSRDEELHPGEPDQQSGTLPHL